MKLENLDKNQKELFVILMNNLEGEDFKRVGELMAISANKYHQEQLNKLSLDSVSFSLPTDEEIEKQANSALFGFGEVRRKYDDDYYTGYQDGAKWIRDKRNES